MGRLEVVKWGKQLFFLFRILLSQQMEDKQILDASLLHQSFAPYLKDPSLYLLKTVPHNSYLTMDAMRGMCCTLEKLYKKPHQGVHYHNITHAFDVMTVMDQFMSDLEIVKRLKLDSQDRTLILLAAYAHDNGHEGFDNSYYIKNQLELAITYCNVSPLQNMHASNLLHILKLHNIIIPLEKKKMIVGMILATDNMRHHQKLQKLQELKGKKKYSLDYIYEGREIILESLLHAADISNPSKQPQLFDKWSDRIRLEFQAQIKLENKQNYKEPSRQAIAKQKQVFIQILVLPFYMELKNIFPVFSGYVREIEHNLWKVRSQENKIEQLK